VRRARETDDEGATEEISTTRLEALSDGVFAVAITLLALNLTVPPVSKEGATAYLGAALGKEWPSYLAYALSFLSILIMWLNHHTIFRLVKRTDHALLLINGLLLMVITAIPFATVLLASYLTAPNDIVDTKIAQGVYSGLLLVMATVYSRLWAYASHKNRLLDANADQTTAKNISKQYRFGPFVYAVAMTTDIVSPYLSLALCIILAVFFALPNSVTRALER